jgi:hypothetical protein
MAGKNSGKLEGLDEEINERFPRTPRSVPSSVAGRVKRGGSCPFCKRKGRPDCLGKYCPNK